MLNNTHKQISGKGMRIGIVRSRFNEDITAGLLNGAAEVLEKAGLLKKDVLLLEVPGSYEIPLAADRLLKPKHLDAVICIGALIQGDTPHFEYISRAVASGIMQVGLRHGKPCSLGVITCFTREQAEERSIPGEMNKGAEAAHAALEMVAKLRKLA